MIRKILALSLVASTLWTTSWATAPVRAQVTPPQEAPVTAEQVREHLAVIAELRGTIDRSHFETEALLEDLDFEPEALIRFLRDEIVFEQYPGLLRGAQGTFMSRAGNSLDQAVLLATLLKNAGLEARIARGSLSTEQARSLLAQMPTRVEPLAAPSDIDRWNALAARSGDFNPVRPMGLDGPTNWEVAMTARTAELLEKAMDRSVSKTSGYSDDLLEEARDYFWVEYRDGSADPWKALHPAFKDSSSAPTDLQAGDRFSDTIPQELQHQLRFEVFIERSELDNLKSRQVIPAWQRPVANLIGRSFSISNYPDGFKGDLRDLDFEKALAESTMFTPLLNGDVAPGATGFDLDGVPYDLTATAGGFGAAPLFKTVGEKTDRATAALRGLGSSKSSPERTRYLTAQWIEYTLVAPGGDETTFRRYLFDRIGPAARETGKTSGLQLERAQPWEVFVNEEFLVAPGSYPRSLVLDEHLNANAMATEIRHEINQTGTLSEASAKRFWSQTRGQNADLILALLDSFDAGFDVQAGGATYRAEPTLFALHWELTGPDSGEMSTDIVSNRRRAHEWKDEATARKTIALQGVWETVAEGRAADMVGLTALRRTSPLTVTEDALARGEQLVLIEHPDDPRLQGIGLDPDSQSLVREELLRGREVALVPYQDPERLAWWSIDPSSGSVIGMLPNGRGATATEYLIVAVLVVLFVIGVIKYAYGDCIALKWEMADLCGAKNNVGTRLTEQMCKGMENPQSVKGWPAHKICKCGGYSPEPACKQQL